MQLLLSSRVSLRPVKLLFFWYQDQAKSKLIQLSRIWCSLNSGTDSYWFWGISNQSLLTFLFQYVFFGLGLFCLFGVIFSFIILFRLLRMFRSIKFINKMFAVLFLVNSIASLLTFRWLFEIGFRNFPAENMHSSSKPSDGLVRACRSFIIALFAGQVTLVAGNSGILFCSYPV